ncbi:MAG: DUF1543 domain-containing protein [Pseudomonadota bacterium]
MPKLFMILVGGMVEGCHVELHDVRFAIGDTIDDCIPALRAQWWGIPKSLHLDAWGAVEAVDGFSITLTEKGAVQRADADHKLFFCNMGGYDPAQFTELHENVLVVAESAQEARRKAIKRIKHWTSPHKDAVLACETVIDVASAAGSDWHVALTQTPDHKSGADDFAFEARYVPIGR